MMIPSHRRLPRLAVALCMVCACAPWGDDDDAALVDPSQAIPSGPLSLVAADGTFQTRWPKPGRYASNVRYSQSGSCSQSWGQYAATASLVLEIADAATVTACRGLAYQQLGGTWDGGDESYGGQMQQGMSGTWHRDGTSIELRMSPDDSVCPPVSAGVVSGLDDAWALRCTGLADDSGRSAMSLLGCQFADDQRHYGLGFAVDEVLPGSWIIAGGGPGLQIHEQSGDFAVGPTTVTPSPDRIEFDSWDRDLPTPPGHYVRLPPEP